MKDEYAQGYASFYNSENKELLCITFSIEGKKTREEYKEMIKRKVKRFYEKDIEEEQKTGEKSWALARLEKACKDTYLLKLQLRTEKEIQIIKWYNE